MLYLNAVALVPYIKVPIGSWFVRIEDDHAPLRCVRGRCGGVNFMEDLVGALAHPTEDLDFARWTDASLLTLCFDRLRVLF
jgi:hypothetical protein